MHVDVEDGVVERPHVESGFLARPAQCDRKGIGVSVAVTTLRAAASARACDGAASSTRSPAMSTSHAEPVMWPIRQERWKQSGCESTKASKRATVADSFGHRPRYAARDPFSPRRCMRPGGWERSSPWCASSTPPDHCISLTARTTAIRGCLGATVSSTRPRAACGPAPSLAGLPLLTLPKRPERAYMDILKNIT